MSSSDSPSANTPTTADHRDQGSLWCDPGTVSWVRVSGTDAVRFIDSFTTAAVSRLADGHGSESFFTDVRGQVICMAGVLRCGPDAGEEPAVEILADGDIGSALAEHLERYHIREPIEIADVSAARTTRALLGPTAAAALTSLVAGSRMPADLAGPFDHAAFAFALGNEPAVAARLVACLRRR